MTKYNTAGVQRSFNCLGNSAIIEYKQKKKCVLMYNPHIMLVYIDPSMVEGSPERYIPITRYTHFQRQIAPAFLN